MDAQIYAAFWSLILAQLVEWSFPTPEIYDQKFYLLSTLFKLCGKDTNKEKEAGNGPFLKKYAAFLLIGAISVCSFI